MQTQNSSVTALNSLLRGELAAVETYRQALDKVQGATVRSQLQDCMQSHARRADALRQQVRRLGGEPSDGSGVWGVFAKAVEGSAKLFGEKAAIAALEEGEDHGQKEYREEIGKMDAPSRAFVESLIMPEQERTHSALTTLKRVVQ